MENKQRITKEDLKNIIIRRTELLDEQEDHLSNLDTVIGNGDHGFSIATGFNKVRQNLDNFSDTDIGGFLKKTGFELLK